VQLEGGAVPNPNGRLHRGLKADLKFPNHYLWLVGDTQVDTPEHDVQFGDSEIRSGPSAHGTYRLQYQFNIFIRIVILTVISVPAGHVNNAVGPRKACRTGNQGTALT